MKNLEYLTCPSGDWEVLKLDGKVFYEGHTIPSEKWLELLGNIYRKRVEITQKEVSDEDMEYGIYD